MKETDFIERYRQLRRSLSFWRLISVVLVVGFLLFKFSTLQSSALSPFSTNYIARIQLNGMINDVNNTLKLIEEASADSHVQGVIFTIDSPGGTTTGSEALYHALRELSRRKPTVAFVDTMAASGGYIAALGAQYIVSRETSLVGSIGALFQYFEYYNLLDKVGLAAKEIKSSPLKAEPTGSHPTSPESVKALQTVVDDVYQWFKALVQKRRKLDQASLDRVADGRVFSGRIAKEYGLVDALGDESAAKNWLVSQGLAVELPVVELKTVKKGVLGLISSSFGGKNGKSLLNFFKHLFLLSDQSEALDGKLLFMWKNSY